MCPRMMAGPMLPGVGEPLYQPAFESGSSSDGTWTVPSGFSPRVSIGEVTPSAGMVSDTGAEVCSSSPFAGLLNEGSTIGVVFFGVLGAVVLGAVLPGAV